MRIRSCMYVCRYRLFTYRTLSIRSSGLLTIIMSSSPFIFLGTIIGVFLTVIMGTSSTSDAPVFAPSKNHITFSTVTGYFLQDDPTTNASTFDFVR